MTTSIDQDRVNALHEQSIIVNGCAPTRATLPLALDKYSEGGVTATNLTAANNEGFAEAVKWFGRCLTEIVAHPGETRVARSVNDIRAAKAQGATTIVMGTQNGDPIEDDIHNLDVFYQLALRIFQITYQRKNRLGDGCGEATDGGLSIFGRQVVGRLNELGILIDLSHVGHRTTMETMEFSSDPVSFTHANLYSINPLSRNKTDDQIKALAERNGVMGITAVSRLMTAKGKMNGTILSEFLDQIDYVADLVGAKHVGIGLDIYEGMTEEGFLERRRTFLARFPELGGEFPFEHYYNRDVGSAADLKNVTAGLVERGYDDNEIQGILGENFLRLFEQVWRTE